MGFCFWTPTGQSRRMGLSQRRSGENISISRPFKAAGVCVVRRGGELESSRPGGAGGGKAAGTSVHRLCRQHQHALLSLLGTKRNSGCLSPCLEWSSNSRRPVAFSPPLLRATDPSLTDREGNVQMVWVSAASGSHCRALYPHRLTTQRTCFF